MYALIVQASKQACMHVCAPSPSCTVATDGGWLDSNKKSQLGDVTQAHDARARCHKSVVHAGVCGDVRRVNHDDVEYLRSGSILLAQASRDTR